MASNSGPDGNVCVIQSFLFLAEWWDSFYDEFEGPDSVPPVEWSCSEKLLLKHHRQTQLNIEKGQVARHRSLYTNSRFGHFYGMGGNNFGWTNFGWGVGGVRVGIFFYIREKLCQKMKK
jgi:hypothetical protein